jgi:hypothetical protein
MKIKLQEIAHARSGDKGPNSNVGLIFRHPKIYNWALNHITNALVKAHFGTMVKGEVKRYKMNNLWALNFILYDSLGGGGSESLLNDAQGKTHGQALLLMEIDLPENLRSFINE